MTKLKNPLLSLKASGTLARVLTFVRRGKVDIVEKKPELLDAKSEPQLAWRTMFNLCVDLWHELSAAEKAVWEAAGTARHMTGYAWYLSQCLRPNPGIYLPLVGGTMQGDIDMAGNKIKDLPAPVGANDAVRKAYVDALDVGEGHILIFPLFYNSIGQGTWALTIASNHPFCGFFKNTSVADGDEVSYKIYLNAGTYTLALLHYTGGDGGIVDIDINGTEIASVDTYSAPGLVAALFTDTGNVIAANGLYDLTLRLDGKNASSSAYTAFINAICLWRTA